MLYCRLNKGIAQMESLLLSQQFTILIHWKCVLSLHPKELFGVCVSTVYTVKRAFSIRYDSTIACEHLAWWCALRAVEFKNHNFVLIHHSFGSFLHWFLFYFIISSSYFFSRQLIVTVNFILHTTSIMWIFSDYCYKKLQLVYWTIADTCYAVNIFWEFFSLKKQMKKKTQTSSNLWAII